MRSGHFILLYCICNKQQQMTRAPSTLPFALEPNPSPQQLQSQYRQHSLPPQSPPTLTPTQPQTRYISNICRAGPMPLTRHSITDPACLLLFLLLTISTLVLFCLNYFSGHLTTEIPISQLNFLQKLSYALKETLPEIMLTCACLIVIGVVCVLLVVAMPVVFGFLVLGASVGFLGFIIYSLVVLQWGNVFYTEESGGTGKPSAQEIETENSLFRICLIVLTSLGTIAALYFIIRRFHKLKHLPAMMKVVKAVLLSNMPVFPLIILLLFNGISMGLWCGFSTLLWNCVRMQQSPQLPISPTLVTILTIVLWLWVHGLMVSGSDYVCQSWVLHWYYRARSQEEGVEGALRENWRLGIFGKLGRYHLGTVLYGALVSTYTVEALAKLARKMLKNRSSKPALIQNIGYLSRYCYIETILECFNFCTANRESYLLRQRIKQKLPEIYMLGHFLEQTIKIILPLCAVYLWFIFTYNLDNFLDKNLINFTPILFLLFCLVIALGIFLELATNIGHLFGIVSDTAVIVYCVDCEIERVHYQGNRAYSVPERLREALMELEVDIKLESYGRQGRAQGGVDEVKY